MDGVLVAAEKINTFSPVFPNADAAKRIARE